MLVYQKKYFLSDNKKIAYFDEGEGEAIFLIHGFASNAYINWVATGWFDFLLKAGYRIIAIDNVGHGDSEKIYNTEVYTPHNMAKDAVNLLGYLGLCQSNFMGYSMGARISAYLALLYPEKVKNLIFGGLGIGMVTGAGSWQPVQEALLEPDITKITHERGLMFRKFADNTKSDKKALALCVIASKQELSQEEVAKINSPCLIVVGENDEISGSAEELAALMPNATAVTLKGRNHMLAVGDKIYKEEVLKFLQHTKNERNNEKG